MKSAYIGLGSNLGDRLSHLKQSMLLLLNDPNTKLVSCSCVYETEPVGGPAQNRFLNACILIKTNLTPIILLQNMLEIENELKRVRKERWGPRTIDLDLLIYENLTMNTPFLRLPHPRLTKRDFVLVPLADIAPDLKIPAQEKNIKSILEEREHNPGITWFCHSNWCEF
ncbi:MAG: 2-amino-4-hydroxy-6-hydroxymethyldihydropteridine diphosphokinase [Bacillota bacterium]